MSRKVSTPNLQSAAINKLPMETIQHLTKKLYAVLTEVQETQNFMAPGYSCYAILLKTGKMLGIKKDTTAYYGNKQYPAFILRLPSKAGIIPIVIEHPEAYMSEIASLSYKQLYQMTNLLWDALQEMPEVYNRVDMEKLLEKM